MKLLLKYICLYIGSVIHKNRKSKVLYYHDVGTQYTDMGTDVELIEAHLNAIQNEGFNIVNEIKSPINEILIAFDDGWHGLYDAKDFFVEKGIYPTVFVAVELINKPGYLSLQEILELKQIGFRFESHTWSHKGLPDYTSDSDLAHELIGSKQWLEKELGGTVEGICFPQGRFSDYVITKCIDAGYQRIYSSLYGSIDTLLSKHGIICRILLHNVPVGHIKYIIKGDSALYRYRLFKLHYSS